MAHSMGSPWWKNGAHNGIIAIDNDGGGATINKVAQEAH